ncbi:MAG: ribosome silencing factor [Sphingomonadales bacterium]|nr:ribosome silencing factor [Sphingomonadales bacterium]
MPCAGVRRGAQPPEDNVLSHLSLASGATGAVVARMTADMAAGAQITSEQILARVIDSLEDDKAEDIVTIDLRGRSSIADYMVICSGRSSRQVGAIAEKLVERLKTDFGRMSKIEGKDQGDWVLIDTADVIVHVFRPEVREFYQLEKMWMPSGARV